MAEELRPFKILQVRPLRFQDHGKDIILAIDTLGAGIGEYVIVGTGTRIINIVFDHTVPFKTAVLAIVDGYNLEDRAI